MKTEDEINEQIKKFQKLNLEYITLVDTKKSDTIIKTLKWVLGKEVDYW